MIETRKKALSQGEFIAMIAMMFATIAFSIDAMLPALPDIGATLSPDDVNQAQLIVTSFVMGMGLGTFFTGPLSDAFGRKPVIFVGCSLYCLGALASYFSQSLETILFSRLLMGLGAAAPRVVALAIVRDLYVGRDMARIMSLAMMIFTLVPAFAPLLGSGIIAISSWRGIFAALDGGAPRRTAEERKQTSVPPAATDRCPTRDGQPSNRAPINPRTDVLYVHVVHCYHHGTARL